jgi:uncharacterized caspase-like protein
MRPGVWRIVSVWLVACFALAVPGMARAETRAALVIGIGAYDQARKLKNPVADARAMETALTALGFRVTLETDRSLRQLSRAVDDFVEENRSADVVLFYFAGHGIEVGGRNALLPRDAKTTDPAAVAASSLPLDSVVERLSTIGRKRILILDACRDDPLGGSGTGRGLALSDEPSAPVRRGLGRLGRADGLLYTFATSPGATAADGEGANSPFTTALAEHLGKEGLEVRSVMSLVQMEVYERTRGAQVPYVESGLTDLFFAGTAGKPLPERDRLLIAMARIDADTRAAVERVAKGADVPLAPLYGALFAAEAEGALSPADRERRLTQAADAFRKVRDELRALSSADPAVTALRQQAERDLALGAFEQARAALTKAIEEDQASSETLEARLRERQLSQAASLSARGGVSRSQPSRANFASAIADAGRAADLAARWDTGLSRRYRIEQAQGQHRLGEEFDDRDALTASAASWRRLIAGVTPASDPQAFGALQNDLGNVLQLIGSRGGDHGALDAAAVAYREAANTFAALNAPTQAAIVQNNLGNVLKALGERETGTARFDEAVAAYTGAAERLRAFGLTDQAALAMINAGITERLIGMRVSGTARLDRSVAALRGALSTLSRATYPREWLIASTELGQTLVALGERSGNAQPLSEAIALYRDALALATRENAAYHWSRIHEWLGHALVAQAGQRPGTADYVAALAAYRSALEERPRIQAPGEWAALQASIGATEATLFERDNDIRHLREAATALRAALEIHTRAVAPEAFAHTRYNLGFVLRRLGEETNDVAALRESAAAYGDALSLTNRNTDLDGWAIAQGSLHLAEAGIAKRTGDAALARSALSGLEQIAALLRQANRTDTLGKVERHLGPTRDLVAELERTRGRQSMPSAPGGAGALGGAGATAAPGPARPPATGGWFAPPPPRP